MALLKKLQISGIRSFGPEPEHVGVMNFETPVTLILGQNGCGKTTILESIKYALSGDLPFGSKNGQGFINDPNISGKVEVKGQVRLKIVDINGHDIIIVRSAQVTKQKHGVLRFKTLDTSVKQNDGAFSGRCVDIAAYCMETLHVSPCILNNVLLCHQENSSWPLEEGQKLKEKFDEIFDSAKYNKCVDIYRKVLKTKETDLKVLKKEVEYRKENKERVDKLRTKLQDRENDFEEKTNFIKSKQNQIAPLEERFREIRELEEDFGQLEKNLASKKSTKEGLREQQKTIEKNITIKFNGSDEELQNKIASFESDRNNDEKLLEDLKFKKAHIETQEKALGNELQKLQIKIGQLKEEKRQQDQRIVEVKSLIDTAKNKFNISDAVNEDNFDLIINKVREEFKNFEESMDDKMMAASTEETVLQDEIDKLKEKKVKEQQTVASKKENLCEHENKIKEINNKLQDLSVVDSQLGGLSGKMVDFDKTIFALKKSFNSEENSNLIKKYTLDLDKMEKNQSELDRVYRVLQKNSALLEKIDTDKQSMIRKQSDIKKIMNKNSGNLEKLFEKNIPKSLKNAIKDILDKSESSVKNLQSSINEKQKTVTSLEYKKQNVSEKLRSCEKELQSHQKKVNEVCKGENFEVLLSRVEKQRDSLHRDKATCTSGVVMYETFINKFEELQPCCPICKTDFTNKTTAVKQIINNLRAEISTAPNRLVKIGGELKKQEELYNRLQRLKSVNESIADLTVNTIPSLNNELETLDNAYSRASSELNELTNKITLPQETVELCRNLMTDAAFLDEYNNDVNRYVQNIKSMEQQLFDVDTSKSLQELEAEIDTIKIDVTTLRKNIENLKLKGDQHKSRLHDLTEQKNALFLKQMDFQKLIQMKPDLTNELSERREKVELLKSEIKVKEASLNTLSKNLQESLQKKSKMLAEHSKITLSLRKQFNEHEKLIDDIDRIHKNIKAYLQENKDEIISAQVEKLAQIKQKEESLIDAKNKIIDAISLKNQELAKEESNFRALHNIVLFREKLTEEKQIDAEIQVLEKQIGDKDLTAIHHEKRRIQKIYENLSSEISNLNGQQNQLKREIQEQKLELNKSENKNAFNNYRDKYYESTVVEAVIRDIKKYIKALEDAILEFHKDKMKQINKTIRDLWRNIYRGNDIDFIEIKPEEAAGTASKRRSYNYKVVQVKRDVELEMRGRCSAGQKVLACLVIRMALAEIFSSTCGILALDEPTTNLDRENIASLCDALSKVILSRQIERNFQLLIITHDEEFLNTLVHVQGVSHYYKVSRNPLGYSVIKKEDL